MKRLIGAAMVFALGLCFFAAPAAYGAEPAFERLPLGSITAQGWIHQQLLRSKDGMGGHLDELEPEMIGRPYVTRDHQSTVSPGWSGEISGTYWAGLIPLAFTLNDAELVAKADRWVHTFLALQEEDGYLGSYRPTENRQEDYCPWSANWGYRALLAWYDATGEQAVLDAVHKGLLWYVEHWSGNTKTSYAAPTLIESMIDVWRLTGDERLAQWSAEYLDWLDENDPFHHSRRALLRPELQFNEDHVVAFGENVKNPALVWLFSQKAEDLEASQNGIRQVWAKCRQINGASASNGEHHAPSASHHVTEYCNFPTWQNSFLRLLAITGNAHYADLAERICFNAGEGARKKDERAIAYFSSPNQFFATLAAELFHPTDFGVYAPNYNVACCPAQSVRLIPEYVRSMALRDTDGNIALALYGPCKINLTDKTDKNGDSDKAATFTEETSYPFDGKVTLKFSGENAFEKSLRLKIPGWCKEFTITHGGEKIEAKNADGWATVSGPYSSGETLEIDFGMEPKIVAAPDVYFPNEPLRSVEYGPLLFSLPYKVAWQPVAGNPITPLPEGWSWQNAVCDGDPGFFALVPETLDGREKIEVVTKNIAPTDYPWENPPIALSVPMIRTQKHAWPYGAYTFHHLHHTLPPYGNPVTPDENAAVERVELVPYGCTNLRLTCFPVTK